MNLTFEIKNEFFAAFSLEVYLNLAGENHVKRLRELALPDDNRVPEEGFYYRFSGEGVQFIFPQAPEQRNVFQAERHANLTILK